MTTASPIVFYDLLPEPGVCPYAQRAWIALVELVETLATLSLFVARTCNLPRKGDSQIVFLGVSALQHDAILVDTGRSLHDQVCGQGQQE